MVNFKYNSVGPKGENTLSTVSVLKNPDREKIKNAELAEKNINKWLNKFDLAENVDVEEMFY